MIDMELNGQDDIDMAKGRIVAYHPVSTNIRKIEVPIRLDAHTGVFSAEFDGEPVRGTHMLSVRNTIDNLAKDADNYEWRPVIIVENSVHIDHAQNYIGMKLGFHVSYVSRHPSGGPDLVQCDANIENGAVSRSPVSVCRFFPDGRVVINYTPERLHALKLLALDITSLSNRFDSIINEPNLDRLDGKQLLLTGKT